MLPHQFLVSTQRIFSTDTRAGSSCRFGSSAMPESPIPSLLHRHHYPPLFTQRRGIGILRTSPLKNSRKWPIWRCDRVLRLATIHAALVRLGGWLVQDQYCGNCGQELRAADRFCPGCGQPVPEPARASPQDGEAAPSPTPPQEVDAATPPAKQHEDAEVKEWWQTK